MSLRSIILSILTVSTISCTVKEERSLCPCQLTVDLSDASEVHGPAQVSIWGLSEMFCSEEIPITGRADSFTKKVTKCEIEISAVQGLEHNKIIGRNVIINEGDDSDRVMAYCDVIDCFQEQAKAKATFLKNWSTLTIKYENPGGGEYPYEFVISGEINGFDAFSMTPVRGKFRHKSVKTVPDKDEFKTNLPRQFNEDCALKLTIMNKRSGEVEKEYDLNEIITESRYDWTCKNLNDLEIYINYAGLLAGVEIKEWENGSDFSVWI